MTTILPQLHEGRDGQTQLYKLVNQLRRYLPGPAQTVIPVGVIDLLTGGQTLAVEANAGGWVTKFIDVIPVSIAGVQSSGPEIRLGSNASFDDVVAAVNLGTALVVGERVGLTLVTPVLSLSDPIYVDVSIPGSGPTSLTAMVYAGGYFR